MNLIGLIGKKVDQTQSFLEDGTRVPVSLVSVSPNVVTQIKKIDKEGYNAVQLGFDIAKKPSKPMSGHGKKARLAFTPRFLREMRVQEAPSLEVGTSIKAEEVFQPGDVVDVAGTSKGKGFAGVVKRHHFKGGPRTHGQSDRERAPGSIGQTTTPGRVYKGKKMAGRMGDETVTVKNLLILDVAGDTVFVRGLIPGPRGSVVLINKVGTAKKFTPLFKKEEAVQQGQNQVQAIEQSATEAVKEEQVPEIVQEEAEEEIQEEALAEK